MTEKTKKESKKAVAKKAPIKVQANTQANAPVQEDVYPAIEIAKMYGLSDFAFFIIKQAENIDDTTLLTVDTFKKYYSKNIEGR